jgi:hypothetical protein
MTGAQFEIYVDGKTRSFRDTKLAAMAGTEFLKIGIHSDVAVKDSLTGEINPVVFKPV